MKAFRDGTRTRTDCHDGNRWHPDVFRNQKEYEPTLLVPMGLGTILVNFPNSGVLSAGGEPGPFQVLFDMGISTELFPLLLFIGIGAMIDFGPLLQKSFFCFYLGLQPNLVFSFTIIVAVLFGFDLNDAASIGIIGAADGPTSIFVANTLNSKYMGEQSWLQLILIWLWCRSFSRLRSRRSQRKKERSIHMNYRAGEVSQTAKILFPIVISVVAGLIAPVSLPLVGFLMFGNLLRECGVLDRLFYHSSK